MEKRQVLLIGMQPLLGEGLRRIFQKLEDVDLVSLDCADTPVVEACIQDLHPAMVLLAGEKEDDRSTHLIAYLLRKYEEIPVVWVELETTVLRLYTSRSLTANSAELIHAIREQETGTFEIHFTDKRSHPGN